MATLNDVMKNDRFAAEAGVELMEIKPGYVRARMLVTPNHLNAGGVCQGGALFTLADLAFAAVANSCGQLTLTLSGNITFLHSVREGYVYAEARETAPHPRAPYIEVRLSDEAGQLIAVMVGSAYRKQDKIPFEGLM